MSKRAKLPRIYADDAVRNIQQFVKDEIDDNGDFDGEDGNYIDNLEKLQNENGKYTDYYFGMKIDENLMAQGVARNEKSVRYMIIANFDVLAIWKATKRLKKTLTRKPKKPIVN